MHRSRIHWTFKNRQIQVIQYIKSSTLSSDMNLSKLREMVKDGRPGMLPSMGSQRLGHHLATEQQQNHLLAKNSGEESFHLSQRWE